ncbi:MAG: hypothetical protein KatS3mg022_2893 [Armatimonadota bacterium]|nr:MAG: hypothetical protein KatS3mg022_2893 [Armatimonadota bacterium]
MRHPVLARTKEVMSAVQFTEGGEFRPTLVIGLGGSGVETARRLKRILRERYQMNTLISFLFIDTDEGVYTEDGDLAAVEEYERASVVVHNPEKLISELRRDRNLHPYFEQFLGDGIDVVILKDAIGAAGIRPVGRFAFHASFDTIYPGLHYASDTAHHASTHSCPSNDARRTAKHQGCPFSTAHLHYQLPVWRNRIWHLFRHGASRPASDGTEQP